VLLYTEQAALLPVRTVLGVTALGDEDRRELPQRVRGAARAGPAPSAQPMLSEELRQRIRAAVRAERGEAVGQDQELASEPKRRVTSPGPTRNDAASPTTNGVDLAIESQRPVPPIESGRAAEPAAPERTSAPIKSGRIPGPAPPERIAGPAAPAHAAEPVKSGPTVKPIELVKREPAAQPKPIEIAPANHKPAAVPRADRSERHRADEPEQPVRRRLVTARLAASALAVIAAASLALAVTSYITRSPAETQAPSPAGQHQETRVGKQAATWVTQQVSPHDIVACDRLMCAALAADGFPQRQLLVLGSTSPYPKTSAVVIETAAVRNLFGTSLHAYAPAVLAAFGSGDSQITIRVIAPDGAAAYDTALGKDLAARKEFAADLLRVNVITLSPTARKQLIAGQADSRLLLAIAALATKLPVDIVQFGNIGAGADADIPLRYADLAQDDQAAHLSASAYEQSMRADLGTVQAGYRPTSIATVVLPGGQTVLRIEFTAPSPLGLFNPQGTP
jgi:hypothetical protein